MIPAFLKGCQLCGGNTEDSKTRSRDCFEKRQVQAVRLSCGGLNREGEYQGADSVGSVLH